MASTPEFWLAVSFFCFVVLIFYLKIPSAVLRQLDDRSDRIKAELDEAQRIREEAQSILAEYQRKRRDSGREVDEIIADAHSEVLRYSKEAKELLSETLERRLQNALCKIAQAENQALISIRSLAVNLAIVATQDVLELKISDKVHNSLHDACIRDIKMKLN